jgi:hypothetical protein
MSANAQSRRSFVLAGLSAPVTAAIPAAVAAPADPDADLLALGREHDALTLERNRLKLSFEKVDDACEAEIEAWRNAHPEPWREAERKAWSKELWKVTKAVWLAADRDQHPFWAVDARQSAVSDKISKLAAHTLAGFAVKARVLGEFTLKEEDWNTPLSDLDFDKHLTRDLIENLCALVGVDRLGRPLDAGRA